MQIGKTDEFDVEVRNRENGRCALIARGLSHDARDKFFERYKLKEEPIKWYLEQAPDPKQARTPWAAEYARRLREERKTKLTVWDHGGQLSVYAVDEKNSSTRIGNVESADEVGREQVAIGLIAEDALPKYMRNLRQELAEARARAKVPTNQ